MPRPRKRFGQHWLKSEAILQQIIDAAELKESDRVLEIGPGQGVLTRRLLPLVAALVSVEIDRDLCHKLAQQLGKIDNFLLLEANFLSLDLEQALIPFPRFQSPHKVVANIPYNITAPILETLLGTIAHPITAYDRIVLLVQKEVGDRLTASPSSKAYSALSVRMQYLAQTELICSVPARAFSPPPKVESAVVRLIPRPYPQSVRNPPFLDRLLKLGFANRRKMLRNNLKSLSEGDRLTPLLEQLEINPQTRAEDLSLSQWIDLSDRLNSLC
jgi:16S rRNA (adenine1518-N6/adenine1519-N6)-dimethyltransferase